MGERQQSSLPCTIPNASCLPEVPGRSSVHCFTLPYDRRAASHAGQKRTVTHLRFTCGLNLCGSSRTGVRIELRCWRSPCWLSLTYWIGGRVGGWGGGNRKPLRATPCDVSRGLDCGLPLVGHPVSTGGLAIQELSATCHRHAWKRIQLTRIAQRSRDRSAPSATFLRCWPSSWSSSVSSPLSSCPAPFVAIATSILARAGTPSPRQRSPASRASRPHSLQSTSMCLEVGTCTFSRAGRTMTHPSGCRRDLLARRWPSMGWCTTRHARLRGGAGGAGVTTTGTATRGTTAGVTSRTITLAARC